MATEFQDAFSLRLRQIQELGKYGQFEKKALEVAPRTQCVEGGTGGEEDEGADVSSMAGTLMISLVCQLIALILCAIEYWTGTPIQKILGFGMSEDESDGAEILESPSGKGRVTDTFIQKMFSSGTSENESDGDEISKEPGGKDRMNLIVGHALERLAEEVKSGKVSWMDKALASSQRPAMQFAREDHPFSISAQIGSHVATNQVSEFEIEPTLELDSVGHRP